MNMGGNLGGFISPAVTPMLAAALGWERALELAGMIGVIAGLLWLWVTPGEATPLLAAEAQRAQSPTA